MSDELYPLLFEPVLKDYIWGGRALADRLSRPLPPGDTAESWEIAAHDDGVTTVINGRFAGQPLTTVHDELGLDLIGRKNAWAQERGKFPLLIKLLDASDKLSVQVHPGDDYALVHEGNELGKTEMWVVLHAAPGAGLILGLRGGATPDRFRAALREGRLEELLHRLPVKAGDFVCVPSGTVHAILEGVLIAEIQQNSNTTYRVFDWNRVKDGLARPLHIAQALDVINFEQVEPQLPEARPLPSPAGTTRERLCSNRYFTAERITLEAGAAFDGNLDGSTLEIWGVIDGSVRVQDVDLNAVQFCLMPAAMGPYSVRSAGGATCLRTYVT